MCAPQPGQTHAHPTSSPTPIHTLAPAGVGISEMQDSSKSAQLIASASACASILCLDIWRYVQTEKRSAEQAGVEWMETCSCSGARVGSTLDRCEWLLRTAVVNGGCRKSSRRHDAAPHSHVQIVTANGRCKRLVRVIFPTTRHDTIPRSRVPRALMNQLSSPDLAALSLSL